MFTMLKGSVYKEVITILNQCVHSELVLNCIKQKLMETKGELDKSPVVLREFMILLSIAGRLWMTRK